MRRPPPGTTTGDTESTEARGSAVGTSAGFLSQGSSALYGNSYIDSFFIQPLSPERLEKPLRHSGLVIRHSFVLGYFGLRHSDGWCHNCARSFSARLARALP
jgi:hypothetical protein